MQQVVEVRDESALQQAMMASEGAIVLYFWWKADPTIDALFAQLCVDTPHARFFRVEAEDHPQISAAFNVSTSPSFLFMKDGEVVDKLEGSNPAELANKVSKLAGPRTVVQAAAPASLGMAGGPATIEAVQQEARAHEPLDGSCHNINTSCS